MRDSDCLLLPVTVGMPQGLWKDAGPPISLESQKLLHEAWPGICQLHSSESQEHGLSAAGSQLDWDTQMGLTAELRPLLHKQLSENTKKTGRLSSPSQ